MCFIKNVGFCVYVKIIQGMKIVFLTKDSS